jgi:hypothetical protein
MRLNPGVFDVRVFRRTPDGVRYLLLHASQSKADRHFNGGRFWQVPSNAFGESETVTAGIDRELTQHGIAARSIWTAGLKDGLRWTREYVTGPAQPARELCLR